MKPFNLVCFCVLMDHHHSGVEQAHPNYIADKFDLFSKIDETQAIAMLDAGNKARVLTWCENWKVDAPSSLTPRRVRTSVFDGLDSVPASSIQ